MKNPYLSNSDESKRWKIEKEIYEAGQKLIKDMKEYVVDKILFVREVIPRKQKRDDDYTPIGEKYYEICVMLDYKTQHPDIVYLQIKGEDFDNWKKLKERI